MYRLIGFFILVAALSGCATKYSTDKMVSSNELTLDVPIPATLMVECEEYQEFLTSDIESVIITHAENMEKAIICKDRHNTLIEVLKERNYE